MLANETVLVTGATGFTGKYLCSALEKHGYQVQKLEISTKAIRLEDTASLLEILKASKPKFVIHLAAISRIQSGDSRIDYKEYYHTNLIGTRCFIDALIKSKLKFQNIILASSSTVYGTTTEKRGISEDDQVGPENDYAVSKLAMEYSALMFYPELPITIVRPFNYTGLGQSPDFVVPKIVNAFRNREKSIVLGNTTMYRDFSDVRYVSEVYCNLLGMGSLPKILNICSGIGTSISHIIKMCEKITEHKINVEYDQKFARTNDMSFQIGDNRRLLRMCPRVKPIVLYDTLKWMLNA